ncbi:hypothetical protein USB125703_01569 [Pseudoclavibacter triregionum]|nr:hypothetical protein USB125703_01569 [Pseudoclavibacter triregionum]
MTRPSAAPDDLTPRASAAGSAPDSNPRKRRRWGRILGFSFLGLVAVLAIGALALCLLKPWAPKIEVSEPGPDGTRVEISGAPANYYPPAPGALPASGAVSAPAVLVLGGSEGGMASGVDEQSRALAAAGYHALTLAYFGAEGQPKAMEALPLERFDEALAWLAAQPGVDPGRMAVLGTSKGGEAALLVGAAHPELKAVVANVPSSVVWQGMDLQEPWRMGSLGSTWSRGGAEVPFLPYPEQVPNGPLATFYEAGLAAVGGHPDAVIPVEKITGDLLLVCGEADEMWPSCEMSRQIEERAAGGPEVTLLSYPDAGHFASGVPVDASAPGYSSLDGLGGTVEGNAAARADSWPRTLDHLAAAFAA